MVIERQSAMKVISAQEAVRLAPWDPNGYIGLAQALPLTGALHEAGEAIQEAIRLAPNSATTWAAGEAASRWRRRTGTRQSRPVIRRWRLIPTTMPLGTTWVLLYGHRARRGQVPRR